MEKYDLSNIEVLVVDHNQHMLGIIRSILVELGVHGVREATDPKIAYDMFKGHPPDIIFSGWAPGSEELKFLNQVRTAENSPNPFVPIIIVTAYSEQDNVIAARDLGMTEFVAAPVSARAIYDHLCGVIKDKRPFIKEPHFFGPDRRRHESPDYAGDERRSAPETVADEAGGGGDPPDSSTKIIDETAD